MTVSRVPQAPWRQFERQVANLFCFKSYEPVTDTKFAGRQHDILLRGNDEHLGSILVECKYFGSRERVGVKAVEDFAARVIRLRNSGDISAGYLVTNTDFSPEAKGCLFGRVEEKFVFVRTYDFLLRRLINFEPYLKRFTRQYDESRTSQTYEPLEALNRNDGSHGYCDQILAEFVTSQEQSMVVLLGDYGSGKTTSCLHLCYTLAKLSLQQGLTGRIPCYIPLSYFNYCGTAPALISKFLTTDVGVSGTSYDAFEAMHRAGLLVLVLDGFDEMARRVTQQVREESFRAIGALCT